MAELSRVGFFMSCMDHRLQRAVAALYQEVVDQYWSGFDFVSVAGGAGNFKILRNHLRLSQRLHYPDVFVLTAHEDCGAGKDMQDLFKAMRIARLLVEPEDTVRGFWFYKTSDSAWAYREVFLIETKWGKFVQALLAPIAKFFW